MKTSKLAKPVSGAAVARAQEQLKLAAHYLEDGARFSALSHIAAARRTLAGKPVPRGDKFWLLHVEASQ